ncbi:hypothetical protein Poli38472_003681 [Pythium oligandrum]|uniref:Zinc finger protein n=1 Tax=Pythium oligandrum TaxID=41045 RepID=A0A8K1CLN6_PYTOL|nr:hypothetical protein Poli38472_003681 [Pythium oligandrum]|eukprot:TMW65916.1 hypothetical protein Poli38472_003681 [Pythium oligandrum]
MAPPVLKSGPVTRVCHVCGRQYGLSSFDIHLRQCKKLFIAQEELKPPNERRQLPKTPPGLGGGSMDFSGESDRGEEGSKPTREMVEAMNRAAQESFNERMEKCEVCGRTFAEGRLAIHSRSCRPGQAAKRIEDGAAPRNKKETVDYGRAKHYEAADTGSSPVKKSSTRPAANNDDGDFVPPYTASSNGAGPSKAPLTGTLASNRKKIPSTATLQSPLAPSISEIDASAVKKELQGKEEVVGLIQAKIDQWEATTMATLQEIRELKTLFAQLK